MSKRKDNSLLFGMYDTVTQEQEHFLDLIAAPLIDIQIIIIDALAGTGKTQMAIAGAKLRNKPLRYIFAPVEEDTQGFLPGDLITKSEPYTGALKQALIKINEDPSKVIHDPRVNDFMNKDAWVYAHPHTFERGKNYEDETVIIDEAQNFTEHELRKVLTRCIDSCKVIVLGNVKQCDLDNISKSGFEPYMYHAKGYDWIKKIELTHNFRGRVAQWADSI